MRILVVFLLVSAVLVGLECKRSGGTRATSSRSLGLFSRRGGKKNSGRSSRKMNKGSPEETVPLPGSYPKQPATNPGAKVKQAAPVASAPKMEAGVQKLAPVNKPPQNSPPIGWNVQQPQAKSMDVAQNKFAYPTGGSSMGASHAGPYPNTGSSNHYSTGHTYNYGNGYNHQQPGGMGYPNTGGVPSTGHHPAGYNSGTNFGGNPGYGQQGVNPAYGNGGMGSYASHPVMGGNPGMGGYGGNPGMGGYGGNPGMGGYGGNPGMGGYGGNAGYGGMGGFGGMTGMGGYGGYGMSNYGQKKSSFAGTALKSIVGGVLIYSLFNGLTRKPYNVYNIYNKPENASDEFKLPANLITLCPENATSLCTENTAPLCTSENILCVMTSPPTPIKTDGKETETPPCLANATIIGDINTNPQIVNASFTITNQNDNHTETMYCVTTLAVPFIETNSTCTPPNCPNQPEVPPLTPIEQNGGNQTMDQGTKPLN